MMVSTTQSGPGHDGNRDQGLGPTEVTPMNRSTSLFTVTRSVVRTLFFAAAILMPYAAGGVLEQVIL